MKYLPGSAGDLGSEMETRTKIIMKVMKLWFKSQQHSTKSHYYL